MKVKFHCLFDYFARSGKLVTVVQREFHLRFHLDCLETRSSVQLDPFKQSCQDHLLYRLTSLVTCCSSIFQFLIRRLWTHSKIVLCKITKYLHFIFSVQRNLKLKLQLQETEYHLSYACFFLDCHALPGHYYFRLDNYFKLECCVCSSIFIN